MGLKSFLKEQGFITDDSGDKAKEQGSSSGSAQQQDSKVAPTFFPEQKAAVPSGASSSDPSFV
ncbi:MAG TPA: hypothetical protein VGI43_14010, partial [Mucilaginibacter sp.]